MSRPRWHTATRWPSDTQTMADLAKCDLEFVAIMKASDIDSPELQRIAQVAQDRLEWVRAKMNKGDPK